MTARRLAVGGSFLCLFALAGTAGGVAHASERGETPALFVSADRLFDGARLRGPTSLLIRDGTIVSVGRRGSFQPPRGARIIALRGATLLPGFIDLHVHDRSETFTSSGVTGVRNLGEAESNLPPPKDKPGFLRIRSAGPILSVPGGYPTVFWGQGIQADVTSPAQARLVVRRLVDEGAAVIKIALEPGRARTWPMLSRDEVKAIVAEAHRLERIVTVHTRTVAEARTALESGVDELAHLPCDEEAPELMAELARRRVPIVATLHVEFTCPARAANARVFAGAGGNLLYGTDAGAQGIPLGLDIEELRRMRAAGLTNAQVLAAATAKAGHEFCRCSLGRIARGAPADVWAIEGNPVSSLAALTRVKLVIAGGVVVRLR